MKEIESHPLFAIQAALFSLSPFLSLSLSPSPSHSLSSISSPAFARLFLITRSLVDETSVFTSSSSLLPPLLPSHLRLHHPLFSAAAFIPLTHTRTPLSSRRRTHLIRFPAPTLSCLPRRLPAHLVRHSLPHLSSLLPSTHLLLPFRFPDSINLPSSLPPSCLPPLAYSFPHSLTLLFLSRSCSRRQRRSPLRLLLP